MCEIVPYTNTWIDGVRKFNDRMTAGGLEVELRFPEQVDDHLCHDPGAPLFREYFLAIDGEHVRGGYFITHEWWLADGHPCRAANFRLPISEGYINPKFKGLGRTLLRHALRRNPFLYCLGFGDCDRPLPRLLKSEGWPIVKTPFYIRVLRPSRVARNLRSLRTNFFWRLLLDFSSATGICNGISGLHRVRTHGPAGRRIFAPISEFGDWADEFWGKVNTEYSLLAVRGSRPLRLRYPSTDARFIKIAVRDGASLCGWWIGLATSMSSHRHFGCLRVGTLVDCLAMPGSEECVIDAALHALEERDVDLIVTNQSHRHWRQALARNGFLPAPTNRFFSPSPEFARLVEPLADKFPLTHLTRGDGAGPIHL